MRATYLRTPAPVTTTCIGNCWHSVQRKKYRLMHVELPAVVFDGEVGAFAREEEGEVWVVHKTRRIAVE